MSSLTCVEREEDVELEGILALKEDGIPNEGTSEAAVRKRKGQGSQLNNTRISSRASVGICSYSGKNQQALLSMIWQYHSFIHCKPGSIFHSSKNKRYHSFIHELAVSFMIMLMVLDPTPST